MLELEADHRRHAEIENAIRDLKYGVGLNHLPSGRFAANGAWLAVQVERGGLGADRQEFPEISPSKMRFKAPRIYWADPFPPRPGILQSGPPRAADQVISPVVPTWRPRFAKPVFW